MPKAYQLNSAKFITLALADRLDLHLRRLLFSQNHRDATLLLTALKTGARARELLNLKAEDFCPKKRTLLIIGIKGSKDREVPLPRYVSEALEFILKNQSVERIFPISYSRLLQIWHFYRPEQKNFHSLRHTFALKAYLKTKDIKLVQLALGHRNIVNTMIYMDYAYSLTEMRRLVDNG